jgi:hypothetical protein
MGTLKRRARETLAMLNDAEPQPELDVLVDYQRSIRALAKSARNCGLHPGWWSEEERTPAEARS